MALPPNAAQLRSSRAKRGGMLKGVPEPIKKFDEFRAQFYDVLAGADGTGRKLGALLWRTQPSLLAKLGPDTEPSLETFVTLLQNSRRIIPASDSQPQAEKIGVGLYRSLYSASADTRSRLFLELFSRGVYGIPSHPRSPMIPEAVKTATLAVRLLKEQVDVLVFAFYRGSGRQDSPLLEHLAAYLRLVVLPLSMARRKQRSSNTPLVEGSLMETTARSFGALWMKHMLAPDFGPEHARVWGQLIGVILECTEAGPSHPVYRTPAKDDVRAVLFQVLLGVCAVYPPAVEGILAYLGEAPPENLASAFGLDASVTANRKMASVVAPRLKRAVINAVAATPDGIVPAGASAQFLTDLYTSVGKDLLENQAAWGKIVGAFTGALAG